MRGEEEEEDLKMRRGMMEGKEKIIFVLIIRLFVRRLYERLVFICYCQ